MEAHSLSHSVQLRSFMEGVIFSTSYHIYIQVLHDAAWKNTACLAEERCQ